MVRDPYGMDASPSIQTVMDALQDPACRDIVQAIDTPMTASEIADQTDTPLSTTYRKLDLLNEASLVTEQTELRPEGHHTSRYGINFESVHIELDEAREFEVAISRRARSADEQLAQLWSEVRKET